MKKKQDRSTNILIEKSKELHSSSTGGLKERITEELRSERSEHGAI